MRIPGIPEEEEEEEEKGDPPVQANMRGARAGHARAEARSWASRRGGSRAAGPLLQGGSGALFFRKKP